MNKQDILKYYVFIQVVLFIAVFASAFLVIEQSNNLFLYCTVIVTAIYVISVIIFIVTFFFTDYVFEFRVGWLLTATICFVMGILPLVLPLFWFYTINKKDKEIMSSNKSLKHGTAQSAAP